MNSQRQSGGDDSTNLQAGNDLVVINEGNSLAEVKTYVMGLFAENFMAMRGIAEEVAKERVDALTQDLLEKLYANSPEVLTSFNDPAMQAATFEAQAGYAISGEEDLSEVLCDLLVNRAKEPERNLRAMVLEEAVGVAPKLTAIQREALALVFMCRRVASFMGTRDEYIQYRIIDQILPLTPCLTKVRPVDFQHLEYLGVGSSGLAKVTFGKAFADCSHFSAGFSAGILTPELNAKRELITEASPRNPDLIQFQPWASMLERQPEQVQIFFADVREDIDRIAKQYVMADDAVLAEVSATVPAIRDLAEQWEECGIGFFNLTSVGVALGHSYCQRANGFTTPLSIWL